MRLLIVLLPAGVIALLLGIVGGLTRIGASGEVAVPMPAVGWHGPLILFGFLGVLVATERAVALRRRWPFVAPGAGIAGTVLLMAGAPLAVVATAWTLAGVVTGLAVLAIERRHPSIANRCMLASCVAWTLGAGLWGLGLPLASLLPWWAAWLVLMIVGERIQFGKLGWLARTARTITLLGGLLLVGAAAAIVAPEAGMRVAGLACLGLATWLVVVDVSRRIARPGLLWFVSVGLAAAYAWLAVTGLTWLVLAPVEPGLAHDAAVHALFQGFVLGMVVTHAPMIFPAVTGVRMPFHRGYHVHLALLHAGLATRVGGDLLGSPQVARTGSIATAVALALFVAVQATSVARGRMQDHAERVGGTRAGAASAPTTRRARRSSGPA